MKKLIRSALRHPVSTLVAVMAILYFSVIAIQRVKVDIFPEVESPAIYIAMPYGGLSPEYMDGFMANEFQKVLVFVSGVKELEFKSIQGLSLMKLTFYPGTDMAQAQADVATQVSRAMAFLPPGAVPPQVVRFDAGAQPIGQLVFESPSRTIGEIQNLVVNRTRASFVNIEGISAPGPFGGNVRTLVIELDPDKMSTYRINAEEVMQAIAANNFPAPAGNIQIGDVNYMTPVNTMETGTEGFMNTPIRIKSGPTVYIRDIARVRDASDITTGYALANGKRTVYLPVIKKSSASTLSAINNLKKALPGLQEDLPEDVRISFVFDQSEYIVQALKNLMYEGLLGAFLTGLMVLLFLGDKRGAFIVVLTIPIAILSAIIVLYLLGETINIMTLSGLALSVGILVDEATVTIENIHQHFEKEKSKARAIMDALFEISVPKMLILFSILAVLTPSFMMTGIPKDMFMPLSIAVGSAMVASFLASQTFVPVVANWMMRPHKKKDKKRETSFDRFKNKYLEFIGKREGRKWAISISYMLCVILLIGLLFASIGTDILPPSDSKDLQLRIKAVEGTALDKTEAHVIEVEKFIKEQVLPEKLPITSGFVGTHSPNMPINGIFLFGSGSHEGVLQFSLPKNFKQSVSGFKEEIREKLNRAFPELEFTFEPMEIIEKIMGQGHNTPIAIEVTGKSLEEAKIYAQRIKAELQKEAFLRDVHLNEPVDYPNISIEVDRERAAQLGVSLKEISSALTTATSSSRFVNKNLWVDPESGLVFQVQAQLPENQMNALNDLRHLPLKAGATSPILDDVASLAFDKRPGQVNRKGPNRFLTVTANIHGKDLGSASKKVKALIDHLGDPPRGYRAVMTGEPNILKDTLSGLESGLLIAIVVIFLMLASYYQSFKASLVIISVVPAVIAGSLLSLTFFGSTLNLQSYMGMIMSVGVSISNSVLVIDLAEVSRNRLLQTPKESAMRALKARFRPILMTTLAMITGMIPMALGLGEGGGQVAPLGQAVIGGLLFSTLTVLWTLPFIYMGAFNHAQPRKISMDPDDTNSKYYENLQTSKI